MSHGATVIPHVRDVGESVYPHVGETVELNGEYWVPIVHGEGIDDVEWKRLDVGKRNRVGIITNIPKHES